jgi:hypothetical protein
MIAIRKPFLSTNTCRLIPLTFLLPSLPSPALPENLAAIGLSFFSEKSNRAAISFLFSVEEVIQNAIDLLFSVERVIRNAIDLLFSVERAN